MEARLEKIESGEAYIEIVVDAERLEEGLQTAYRKVVRQVSIPGFRKGRVPRELLESHFGKEILYQDALEAIIPDAYEFALAELDIAPIAQPDFDFSSMDDMEAGKPFTFNTKVAVKPDFELPDLTGIEITTPKFAVSEENVAKRLEDMQNRYSQLVEKTDEPAAIGDTAEIDFEGYVDGVAFPGGKGENYPLELGSGSFIPGFEEQVVGLKVGEEADVKVTFPETYHAEDLAGKEAVFKVKVNKIETHELRPLNDEFAQEVSSFDTLEELKADIRDNLAQMIENQRKDFLRQQVLDKAMERTDIPVPDSVVKAQLEVMLEQMAQRLKSQGLSLEMYFQYTQSNVEEFNQEMWPEALRIAKVNFLLEKLIEDQGIEASEEEIDQKIEEASSGLGVDPAKVKETLNNMRDSMAFGLKTDKAVAYLLDNAHITEEDKSTED
ncbi:MAG: trigger factor [Syntrophomonadaceae bacterium]|nr:trigger factor [Syntrophomonadaceae bacterium]